MNTEKLKLWRNNHLTLIFIVVGQFLSALVFVCTYCSDQIVGKHGIQIPTLQILPTSSLLLITIATLSCVKTNTLQFESIKKNWWKYILYALFEVEANFLINKAFQYTSPMSIRVIRNMRYVLVCIFSYLILLLCPLLCCYRFLFLKLNTNYYNILEHSLQLLELFLLLLLML